MARVTVEDCIQVVQNQFDLVLFAGQRARQLASGAPMTLERDNDKNAVLALREIAERTISPDFLREAIIQSNQRIIDSSEEEVGEDMSLAASAEAMRLAAAAPPRPVVDDDDSEE